jgi:hypothetical protein
MNEKEIIKHFGCYYRTDDEMLTLDYQCNCEKHLITVYPNGYLNTYDRKTISVCRNYWAEKIRYHWHTWASRENVLSATAVATLEIMEECGIKHCNGLFGDPWIFWRVTRHQEEEIKGFYRTCGDSRNTIGISYTALLTPQIEVVYDAMPYVHHLLKDPTDIQERDDLITIVKLIFEWLEQSNHKIPKYKCQNYISFLRQWHTTEEIDLKKIELLTEIINAICKERKPNYHPRRQHP